MKSRRPGAERDFIFGESPEAGSYRAFGSR
jgi:hypothetical protein